MRAGEPGMCDDHVGRPTHVSTCIAADHLDISVFSKVHPGPLDERFFAIDGDDRSRRADHFRQDGGIVSGTTADLDDTLVSSPRLLRAFETVPRERLSQLLGICAFAGHGRGIAQRILFDSAQSNAPASSLNDRPTGPTGVSGFAAALARIVDGRRSPPNEEKCHRA